MGDDYHSRTTRAIDSRHVTMSACLFVARDCGESESSRTSMKYLPFAIINERKDVYDVYVCFIMLS